MRRTQIRELDVADGQIDSWKKTFVAFKRSVFDAGAFLGVNHIAAVFRECLAVVGHIAQLNLPLKIRCRFLYRFLNLALRHFGVRLPGSVMPDLFPGVICALGNGDVVTDAVLALTLSDARHRSLLYHRDGQFCFSSAHHSLPNQP